MLQYKYETNGALMRSITNLGINRWQQMHFDDAHFSVRSLVIPHSRWECDIWFSDSGAWTAGHELYS